ncbi:MAG: hypothetical protein PQ964_07005 [Methanobacteriaceae archaeon]|jgi:hypothetical protein
MVDSMVKKDIKKVEINERELHPEFIKEMKRIEKEPKIIIKGDMREYFKKEAEKEDKSED